MDKINHNCFARLNADFERETRYISFDNNQRIIRFFIERSCNKTKIKNTGYFLTTLRRTQFLQFLLFHIINCCAIAVITINNDLNKQT